MEQEMKILVTGGYGFVGQNLVKRLVEDGHEITVTSTGTEEKVPGPGIVKVLYPTLEGIDWFCVRDQDVIFHQMANNDTQSLDRVEMMRANLNGPKKLFQEAFEGGCRNFVYASSTAVYGNSPAPYTEETETQLLTPYAESKKLFDDFAMEFAKEKNVKVTGLRYCNVYGPGEENKGKRMSMIGQILRKKINGEKIELFEYGEQKRDWVHVKDVVNVNLLAMNRSGEDGRLYNIGSGASCNFNELVAYICDTMNTDRIVPYYIPCPFPEKYQNHTECDIEKARKELGFSPSFGFRSGIADYYKNLITGYLQE